VVVEEREQQRIQLVASLLSKYSAIQPLAREIVADRIYDGLKVVKESNLFQGAHAEE